MKLKLIMIFALSLFGIKGIADDHARPFSVFIGISTDNPAAVVGAWDTFMESDCGKSHPGQVSIMNEFFNGENPATHTVVISYPNQNAWAQGIANNRCLEWSQLMRNVSTISEPVFQTLGMPVLAGGDLTKDRAYTIVQMDVSDEAKYASAFEGWIKAQIEAGQKISSYGIVRTVGGSEGNVGTHFAYIGTANGLDQLDNAATSDQKLMQKFRSKVSNIRTVKSVSINYVGKRY
ncbi:hypothetical protein OAL14_07325 [Gammaproteobacteria bacterium]|nr:hypothetical protein [Gammaproteobacteria bacterium]